MASCDFGICQNGEAVLECLGMHLPVVISDNLKTADAYRTLYYDAFISDFNLLVKGEHVPELVGRNFSDKVVEFWSEWLINPQIRYLYYLYTVL